MPAVPRCAQDEECEERGSKWDGLLQKLLKSRTVLVTDEVNKKMAQQVTAQLLILDEEDSKAPIHMYINSPGGDADAGFAMFDMIRFINAPVKTVVGGLAASAAVLVLLGAKKENRYAQPNARLLIHQPSTGIHGDASDIEIEAEEIIKCRDRINQIIADETGQAIKKVEEDTQRNCWLSAQEALEYGLVSKVIASTDEL